MTIDLIKLEKSKSIIKNDYNGYFIFLLSNARHSAFLQSTNRNKNNINLNQMTKRILIIHTDLMNIATIVHRVNYESYALNKNDVSYDLWRYYASLDIELLFRKYRSIFDNIGQMLKSFLGDKGLPNSFHDLYKNIDKYEEIPNELKDPIKESQWFGLIKEIRDKIDHDGAEINVKKNESNEVMFICSELGRSLTNLPERNILDKLDLETDEGFINFNDFVGIYVGYLIWLLEEISSIIYSKLQNSDLDKQSKLAHPGFYVIYDNIERILN